MKKEIRNYSKIEQKANLNEKSDIFIQSFQNVFCLDEPLKENDDLNNINNEEINNNWCDINKLKKKSKSYKINNDSILQIKDIEHTLIKECLKYFSLYVLDIIRNYLKNDENIINYLKNDNEIIFKIK